MNLDRRQLVNGLMSALAMPLIGCTSQNNSTRTHEKEPASMYGLIGKMTAVEGKRDELLDILLKGLSDMPGNLSYIVANDVVDANVLWITEVWKDKEAHLNSLSLPSVKAAITKARPLIAGMERVSETRPVAIVSDGNAIR